MTHQAAKPKHYFYSFSKSTGTEYIRIASSCWKRKGGGRNQTHKLLVLIPLCQLPPPPKAALTLFLLSSQKCSSPFREKEPTDQQARAQGTSSKNFSKKTDSSIFPPLGLIFFILCRNGGASLGGTEGNYEEPRLKDISQISLVVVEFLDYFASKSSWSKERTEGGPCK